MICYTDKVISEELNSLHITFKWLCTKPEYGGAKKSTPEKRSEIYKEIVKREAGPL